MGKEIVKVDPDTLEVTVTNVSLVKKEDLEQKKKDLVQLMSSFQSQLDEINANLELLK